MDAQLDNPAISASLADVAIRLADEGIPVRAIARSVKVPSEDIYDTLRRAIEHGKIVEMPRDDWPAGATRGQRVIPTGTILDNEDAFTVTCQRLFKVTKTEAVMLNLLLKRNEATKVQLHNAIEQAKAGAGAEPTEQKIIDVFICKMRRKLKPYNIEIETIWGTGYMISREHREAAIVLLTNHEKGAV